MNNKDKNLNLTFAQLQKENRILRQNYISVSIMLIYALLLLSVYAFAIGVMNHFDKEYHQIIVTVSALSVFGLFLAIMVFQTKQSWSLFGFNLNNWQQYLVESMAFSIIFCTFITLVKWWMSTNILVLQGIPVFDFGHLAHMGMLGKHTGYFLVLLAAIYILFVPLQTFIAHGAVQSSILNFLPFKHVKWLSIIVSTLFFAAIHVPIDFIYAICMIVPGFFWAMLYARQRSLLGVIISHIIIGIYGLYILGYGHFFVVINKILVP